MLSTPWFVPPCFCMLVFIFSAWQTPALSFLTRNSKDLAVSEASFDDHDPDGMREDEAGLFSGQRTGLLLNTGMHSLAP